MGQGFCENPRSREKLAGAVPRKETCTEPLPLTTSQGAVAGKRRSKLAGNFELY